MGSRIHWIGLTLGRAMPSGLLLLLSAGAGVEAAETFNPPTRNAFSRESSGAVLTLTPSPDAQAIHLQELDSTRVLSLDLEPADLESSLPSLSERQAPETQSPENEAAVDETGAPETDSDSSETPESPTPESDSPETLTEPDSSSDSSSDSSTDADAELEPNSDPAAEAEAAHARWQQLLIEGDRLLLNGQRLEAEQLYQQAKDPDDTDPDPVEYPDTFTDPAQLPPAGQVYWREYQAGRESGMDTRIRVPLQLLTTEYPEFIPAQVDYALLLAESEDEAAKQQAQEQLERATVLFPHSSELARARVDFLAANERWLQAAIAARQFMVLNPDAPVSQTFEADAEDYQERFRSRLRGRLRRNAIGNVVTGTLGFVLTGNLFGPLSALDTTVLMLRGESAVGESIANRAVDDLDLITDDEVVTYVNDIGQELAILAGRDEFEYEFYVIEEDELNAFALPGGKVFVNAGAILKAETEAEFAGLLAHELAHTVLSHGFQIATGGNLTANVLQHVPYGGYITNLAVLRYSRDMERQADTLGTQLLAHSDYAADGLYRLMITLHEESDRRSRFDWLSTHPDTPERIRRLDQLIERNGYNRYAFEGIERHLQIQARVEELLREAEKLEGEDEIDLGSEPDSPEETSDEVEEPEEPEESLEDTSLEDMSSDGTPSESHNSPSLSEEETPNVEESLAAPSEASSD